MGNSMTDFMRNSLGGLHGGNSTEDFIGDSEGRLLRGALTLRGDSRGSSRVKLEDIRVKCEGDEMFFGKVYICSNVVIMS